MREVSYNDEAFKKTLYWCNWCAISLTESGPITGENAALPPMTPMPISFHGLVKLEQTRIGPHGGQIHKRIW
jgi:hypothetical protein